MRGLHSCVLTYPSSPSVLPRVLWMELCICSKFPGHLGQQKNTKNSHNQHYVILADCLWHACNVANPIHVLKPTACGPMPAMMLQCRAPELIQSLARQLATAVLQFEEHAVTTVGKPWQALQCSSALSAAASLRLLTEQRLLQLQLSCTPHTLLGHSRCIQSPGCVQMKPAPWPKGRPPC